VKPLEKYVKKNEQKETMVQTSVNLELKHSKFIKDRNINFSELIRDFLDSLMIDENRDKNEID
jgi:hypothetical protein